MTEPSLQHPNGVQPWGNYLFAQGRDTRNQGLGKLKMLSDELMLQVMSLLPAQSLGRLSCVNRAFYCFSSHEDLWRALTLDAPELEGKWKFSKSWKQTHLKASIPGYQLSKHKPLHVDGFYSDLLYQPWHCANIPLSPKWLKRDTIDRRAHLTVEDFRQQYEVPNKPVILHGTMDDWSALEKWTPKYLKAAFGEQQTLAGDYSMSFENFLAYSRRAHDEMPLYLFDKHFADNVPQLADDYKVCQITYGLASFYICSNRR